MLPTFLGIGAQRCGTTRLHRILASHPEIQMPHRGRDPFNKEIHYFDREVLTQPLSWYAAHFDGGEGGAVRSVRGEITPAYSILPAPVVEQIGRLMPHLRVVFVVRNPVDRIWSALLMTFAAWRPDRPPELPSVAALVRRAERPEVILRTDYLRTLAIWRRVYGSDAVHLVKFEDQFASRQPTLAAILAHIGADPSWVPPVVPEEKVWASPELACPPFLRFHLARRWLGQACALDALFPGRFSDWVADLQAAIEAAPLRWAAMSRALVSGSMPSAIARRAVQATRFERLARRLRRLAVDG
jgi:hypothetical protein